jgi:hypothetical protein
VANEKIREKDDQIKRLKAYVKKLGGMTET